MHVYGTNEAPQSLQGDIRVLNRLIPQIGTNIPVSVEVEGSDSICFVREVQRHPVTEDLLHVDFIRVDVSQVTQAEVPVLLVGEAPATRQGGTLLLQLQTILAYGDKSLRAKTRDVALEVFITFSNSIIS